MRARRVAPESGKESRPVALLPRHSVRLPVTVRQRSVLEPGLEKACPREKRFAYALYRIGREVVWSREAAMRNSVE